MDDLEARPVTILTGFLGSGKTTFLNELLKHYAEYRFAIIENETGQLNIDGMLLAKNYGQLIELQDGCICCTLNDDLYSALETLHEDRDSFDELVIECTGLAMPSTVMEPFTVHPIFKKYFPLKRVICLIDAEFIADQVKERDEVLRQITAADILLINKTVTVHPDYLNDLQTYLLTLNPLARLFCATSKKQFPFEEIEQVSYSYNNNKSFSLVENNKLSAIKAKTFSAFGQQHLSDISYRTYIFPGEFNYIDLFLALSKLVGKHMDRIYRMKGIGYKSDNDKKIVLQTVGSRVDLEYGDYWEEGEEKTNVLVFIGKKLDQLNIETLLNQMLKNPTFEKK